MKYLSSNDLKIRIKLLNSVTERDDLGGTIIDKWIIYKEVWALFEPYKNLLYKIDNFENANLALENLVFFRIRYLNNITNQMRISYKEKTFQIIRSISLNNRFTHISAKEINNE